jgi:hypothetical protein
MSPRDERTQPGSHTAGVVRGVVAAFVAGYRERVGLDDRDLSVDVHYDKAEDPTRFVNLSVTVRLPHATCGDREQALRRVAEHCPVHATISTLERISIEILDRDAVPV